MSMRIHYISVFILLMSLASPLSASGSGEGSLVILDYHSFLGKGTSSLDFSPDELAAQMDRFASLGYRFVSLEDALNGNLEGDNNIAVTIDDGHRTDMDAYFKVLQPRNIPVTLFIPGFSVGHDTHLLSVSQLQSLLLAGCTIGAHGYYHNYMSAKAFKANPASVLTEANRPRMAIAAKIGELPDFFAYPFGGACPEAKAAVQRAGFSWAFAASAKMSEVRPDSSTLDHYSVPRTIVYRWNIGGLIGYLKSRITRRRYPLELRIQGITHPERAI